MSGPAGAPRQVSYPRPPEAFKEDDSKDIYGRLSNAIAPVEAQRTFATINHRATNSMDQQDPTSGEIIILTELDMCHTDCRSDACSED